MRTTAIYRDNLFLEHQTGPGHPESPERLRIIYRELLRLEVSAPFTFPEFSPASTEQIALVHTDELIRRVEDTAGRTFDSLDPDTQTSARSFDAALLAAGALIDGVRRVASGEIDNAFCLVRPPGHHAEADRAMGFCLFNNVAIGAMHALEALGMERVLIYDWDLHHGNGTQHSFYRSDQVLYCSSHQYPYYPGSGSLHEQGEGAGEGHTVNVPLPGGQDDAAFARIARDLVAPLIRAHAPDLVLISCGFDIALGDPLGAMRVTPAGFAAMTRIIAEAADERCGGRLVVALEGGYDLEAMRLGALAVAGELAGGMYGPEHPAEDDILAALDGQPPLAPLDEALSLAKQYWKL